MLNVLFDELNSGVAQRTVVVYVLEVGQHIRLSSPKTARNSALNEFRCIKQNVRCGMLNIC